MSGLSAPAAWRRPAGISPRRATIVAILACGSAGRGDDGAAMEACRLARARLPRGAVIRIVGELGIDDLVAIPADASVVVVDTARGVRPGVIRTVPLDALLEAPGAIRPRSAQALAMPEVLGLAAMIRGRPLHGRIVVIGGREFGAGSSFSERVGARIGRLADAIIAAVDALRSSPGAPPVCA